MQKAGYRIETPNVALLDAIDQRQPATEALGSQVIDDPLAFARALAQHGGRLPAAEVAIDIASTSGTH